MSDKREGQDELDLGTHEQVTLVTLRDMAVDCVMSTHGRYFAESRVALGLPADEGAVRGSAQAIVRLAFETVGGCYDAPTLKALAQVANLLSERSLAWGSSPDRIFECHCEMMRTLGRVELAQKAQMTAALRDN